MDLDDLNGLNNALDNISTISKENVLKSVENNTFENSAKAIYEVLKKLYE